MASTKFRKVSANIEAWCPPAEGKVIQAKFITTREQEKGELLVVELTKSAECFPSEYEGPKLKKGEKRTDGREYPAGTIVGMSLNYALRDLLKYEPGTEFMIEWGKQKDLAGGNSVWEGELSIEEGAKMVPTQKGGAVPF